MLKRFCGSRRCSEEHFTSATPGTAPHLAIDTDTYGFQIRAGNVAGQRKTVDRRLCR